MPGHTRRYEAASAAAGPLGSTAEGYGRSARNSTWRGRTTEKCRRSSVATVSKPSRLGHRDDGGVGSAEGQIGVGLCQLDDAREIGLGHRFDPSPQPAALIEELPLLQTLGEMLGIAFEGQGIGRKRVPVQRVERASLADPLTGLASRTGWQQLLHAEQARQATRNERSVALVVTLEQAGADRSVACSDELDEFLTKVAHTMVGCHSPADLAARLDDHSFAALVPTADADDLADCIPTSLAQQGIAATVSAFPVSAPDTGRPEAKTRRVTKSSAISPRTISRWQRSGRRFEVPERSEED